MSVYNNKVVLLADERHLVDAAFVLRILNGGAKEVRLMGRSETAMQAIRDEILKQQPDAINHIRCFIGDSSDNAYLIESLTNVQYVLGIPSIRPMADCEGNPADAIELLLHSVTNLIHTSTQCDAEKVVVVGPDYQKPLVDLPDMFAALIETVVVAEGRYLGKKSPSAIIYASGYSNLGQIVDYAFCNGINADRIAQADSVIQRFPCLDFSFRREEFEK